MRKLRAINMKIRCDQYGQLSPCRARVSGRLIPDRKYLTDLHLHEATIQEFPKATRFIST